MVYRARWRDKAFTQGLTWDEKAMLNQLTTFDGISAAGVVRADAEILAQSHPDRTASQINEYLSSLAEKGNIVQSGMEIFVVNWFIHQPVQLRGEKNVTSMATAIDRVGYADLRDVVAETLFDALLHIERLDKTATAAPIKRICTELAEHHEMTLPSSLNSGAGK